MVTYCKNPSFIQRILYATAFCIVATLSACKPRQDQSELQNTQPQPVAVDDLPQSVEKKTPPWKGRVGVVMNVTPNSVGIYKRDVVLGFVDMAKTRLLPLAERQINPIYLVINVDTSNLWLSNSIINSRIKSESDQAIKDAIEYLNQHQKAQIFDYQSTSAFLLFINDRNGQYTKRFGFSSAPVSVAILNDQTTVLGKYALENPEANENALKTLDYAIGQWLGAKSAKSE